MEQAARSMLGTGRLGTPLARRPARAPSGRSPSWRISIPAPVSRAIPPERAPLPFRSRVAADEPLAPGPHAEASPGHGHFKGAHVALPGAIFGGSAILFAADLLSDFQSGHGPSHLFLELGVAALVLVGVALFARHVWAILGVADDLRRDLSASERETDHWQAQARQALDGLGAAIDRDFRKWRLTEAERGVALMLLKGLSHKEIAAQRGTNEGTTRQQALAIYRKAGLTGRSGLAAVVLEGLALAERPPAREA